MYSPQHALAELVEGKSLPHQAMTGLMRQIMRGEVPPEQTAALITALRMKGESVGEIAAAAAVMREFALRVPVAQPEDLVDIVGTGGDGAKTFNISTTAMFAAAAAGARVAKHGGRSVSSSCGAADVLEAAGANLNQTPEQVAETIERHGIGFMFAPNHHTAMRHVAPVRKSLGFRTIFNILGPLTNPAAAANQLIGVFDRKLCGLLARVLNELGARRALVVHGSDGLDEITVSGSTFVAELADGHIREYELVPEDLGLPRHADLGCLKVENAQESLAVMNAVLSGETGAARDIVLANAAACLYVSGLSGSLKAGVTAAAAAIDSGRALQKQQAFAAATQAA